MEGGGDILRRVNRLEAPIPELTQVEDRQRETTRDRKN